MLLINEETVRELLPMPRAIRLVKEAFQSLAAGGALNQARRRLVLPSGAVLHAMAGACGEYFGTKIYSTHPAHGAHFLFVLYDAVTAAPLALFEANYLGQIRTGAATGLATDLLALPEIEAVALIGTGFQARSQLEAVLDVRTPRQVRVWSRSPDRRAAFALECSRQQQANVRAVDSAREAVEGAAVVITATSARDPVVESGWIGPGTHVNAVGSNQARRRELPEDLVRRASLIVVDSLEQARIESGDLLLALRDEEWANMPIVELKDVVEGRAARRRTDEVTLFKSNGLGLEDVAVAAYVYEQVKARTAGTEAGPVHS
ncbi:MAG: ornithine cyclodeaminase family protein [Bryobacteraceae bacterium]|nr:ornithine cyclodeaminase family protein [Bryobacteraceae bacterium]